MSREAERIDEARNLYREAIGTARENAAWEYLLATVREIQHEANGPLAPIVVPHHEPEERL